MQAQGGQAGEVDDAGSDQDVGQDAGVSAASGFTPAPGAVGEVADLALHDGPGRSGSFWRALACCRGGFMGVDADGPSPTGCGAGRL